MAEGGTIPTNRTQSVTFYNTTGIIEKEKGIYLSPSFKNKLAGSEVREIYLDVLNAEAVKDQDYEDINISSWSPEDRTLTVRGNIDDFRLITDEGDCLNYLVVTRNVTKNEVTNTYYYGFFITGVAQSGGSAVKLTLEPDTFTNVFYLHNKHVLTAQEVSTTDYEPFNERMKNCHVNRQHYNRVKIETTYTLQVEMNGVSIDPHLEIGKPIIINFEDEAGTQVQGTIIDFDDRDISEGDLFVKISCEEYQEVGAPENFSTFNYEGSNYLFDYTTQGVTWNTIKKYLPDNLKIFLNQEESFKFKYQYKDKKLLFSLSSLFTEAELNTVNNTDSFVNLSNYLRTKILTASLAFLILEMKSQERVGGIVEDWYQDGALQHRYLEPNYQNIYGGFGKYCVNLYSPFFNIPAPFMKYETDIKQFSFMVSLIDCASTATRSLPNAEKIYEEINKNALADFVYSAYLLVDVGIESNDLTIDLINNKIIFKCKSALSRPRYDSISTKDRGLYLSSIYTGQQQDPTYDKWICYEFANNADKERGYVESIPDNRSNEVLPVLMLSDRNTRKYSITVDKEISVNLVSNFYDNVLEAEPYTFYSFSFLSYELPFNKNRYYQDFIINVNENISVNGGIKLGLTPEYKVDNKEYLYYNEGLVFTLSASLPMVSDSYESYYYQNKAQMRNQYAVNDYNRMTDWYQHFFLSGPNAVGQQAFRRGGYGALSEAINQFAQLADEGIDYYQSNKTIDMNIKAKLADMGAKPDNVKQAGSDSFYDLLTSENRLFLNHYTIDKASYDSIAKFLERFGYQINLYDILHVNDRVGWNYIKLNSFDINPAFDIMVGQEQDLMRIFTNGVTLLHNKYYLTNGHNYEKILEE